MIWASFLQEILSNEALSYYARIVSNTYFRMAFACQVSSKVWEPPIIVTPSHLWSPLLQPVVTLVVLFDQNNGPTK